MCGLALGVYGWVPVFKRALLAVPWQGLLETANCFFLHLLGPGKYMWDSYWDLPPFILYTRVLLYGVTLMCQIRGVGYAVSGPKIKSRP